MFTDKPDWQPHTPSQQNLEPGGASMAGFLSRGEKLEDVIERDSRALEILGYTHNEVAALLEAINKKWADSRERNFSWQGPNGRIFQIEVDSYRGSQLCPWGCQVDWHVSSGGSDFTVRENEKEVLFFPGLLPHLIRSHKFFEGSTPYRASPEKIIEILGQEKIAGSVQKVKDVLPTLKTQ